MGTPKIIVTSAGVAGATASSLQRVVILGATGRDFHNFNVYFRYNLNYVVIAFTATQIPNIAGRRYPPALAGPPLSPRHSDCA